MGRENYARRKDIASPYLMAGFHPRNGRRPLKHRLIRWALKVLGLRGRGLDNFTAVQVSRTEIRLPDLPTGFDGYRILHLSDFHFNLLPERLQPAIDHALADLEFDGCVITGDFFEKPPANGDCEALARILHSLGPDAYACLGNHDTLSLVPWIESCGVRVLLNESVAIEQNGERLWLAGVDDPSGFGVPDLDRALREIPEGETILLLAHDPAFSTTVAHNGHVAAMFCGHTHGGQLCLPGGRAIFWNSVCPRQLGAGAWELGCLKGYTSRGVGSGGVPARFNCPPEIALHTLRRG